MSDDHISEPHPLDDREDESEPMPRLDRATLEYVMLVERAAESHPLIRRRAREFSAAAMLLAELQGFEGLPAEDFASLKRFADDIRKGWADRPTETDDRCRRLNAWCFQPGPDEGKDNETSADYETLAAVKEDVALLIISYHVVTMPRRAPDFLAPLRRARIATIIRLEDGRVRLVMVVDEPGGALIEHEDDSLDALLSWLYYRDQQASRLR